VKGDAIAFARGIPKAELHVHLEGTISPEAYARIAARNGLLARDLDTIFRCHDFPSFLRAFLDVVGVLRKPEDFAEVAAEYVVRSAADGVRHIEMFLSPATQRRFVPDLDADATLRAVWDAASGAAAARGMTITFILDMVRNLGEEEALVDIDLALRRRDCGVVGIGLGGDERRFPAREFAGPYDLARSKGLRRTAHAGEAAGAESIEDAILILGAERIGHCTSARGQPEIIALLRGHGIAIDACPTSNAMTGALASGENYPLREFLEAGITVSLNSDDPSFFGASIGDEYAQAVAHGLSMREIAAIARNSFSASFLPEAEKRRRVAEVDAYCSGWGMTR
jgi:aminodeoxyfutalosine deaminase